MASEFVSRLLRGDAVYQVLLVLTLVGSAYVVQNVLYWYAEEKAFEILTKSLPYGDIYPDSVRVSMAAEIPEGNYRRMLWKKTVTTGENEYRVFYHPLPATANCRVARVHEQLTDTVFKAHHHLATAREFMIQAFLCIASASIYFIIAAGALAYIAKTGLAQANVFMTTLLVTSAGIGTFFFGLTKVFKQEENVQRNIELYIQHINLDQSIRSHLINYPGYASHVSEPCQDKDTTFTALVKYIDKRREEVNSISLGFDASSISYLRQLKLEGEGTSTPKSGGEAKPSNR